MSAVLCSGCVEPYEEYVLRGTFSAGNEDYFLWREIDTELRAHGIEAGNLKSGVRDGVWGYQAFFYTLHDCQRAIPILLNLTFIESAFNCSRITYV